MNTGSNMRKLCLLILLMCLSACKINSEGEKIGIIVKCAHEGFFVKTYECEIIRGGINDSSGTLGKSFHFTVEDKSLIPLFERALNEQKEVKLYYHQEWITFFRTETHSNSFGDKIEFREKA